MKAICLRAPKDIMIKEVQYPKRKQDEVLGKVKSVGICGSDVAVYKGVNPLVTFLELLAMKLLGNC